VDFRVDSSNSAGFSFGKKERVFGLGRQIVTDENGRGSFAFFVGRGETPDLGLFTLFTNPIY
jgi:hypothetical protein